MHRYSSLSVRKESYHIRQFKVSCLKFSSHCSFPVSFLLYYCYLNLLISTQHKTCVCVYVCVRMCMCLFFY